ncbi:MAG: extensin family protein [Pseudomonadota bacterium]|nr:MAG: hypothetical protein DIU78_13240 [Pseudomonadota bacterium]
MPSRIALLGFAVVAFACAREIPDPQYPDAHPYPASAWPPPGATASSADRVLARTAQSPVTTRHRGLILSDVALPGGAACLERLGRTGIAFQPIDPRPGIETPVMVSGPIAGVRFWSRGGPLVLDCRLALALYEVSPDFRALGIQSVRFSGAYVYRTTKRGRLSLHAYGLAMDVHEVSTARRTYSVERDFVRGEACGRARALLNELACRLERRGLFRELLTPDYDSDHHDHLHLGISPLPHGAPAVGGTPPPGYGMAPSSSPRSNRLN